ncbi:MAG: M4 family metallopeptidase, partial [Nocardioides sp.]
AVSVSVSPATDRVSALGATHDGDLAPWASGGAARKVAAYLPDYAALVGVDPDELRPAGADRVGDLTSLRFTQRFAGVPVWGSGVRFTVTAGGELSFVNGFLLPGLAQSAPTTDPTVAASAAAERAVAEVLADPPLRAAGTTSTGTGATHRLVARARELVLYPEGAVRGADATPVLTWQITVANRAGVREQVFIDAATGKVINRYSEELAALDRRLFEGTSQVWNEGDPLPGTLETEQQSVLASTADAYWFFQNSFARDSFDGSGARMTARHDAGGGGFICPNAAWDKDVDELRYCTGVAADDVIAHEWAHAYTDAMVPLTYQWQPGSLNEAISDIWGETIDLINAREDAEEGDLLTPRTDQCSTHSPTVPVLTITGPSSIARDCVATLASFGPQLTTTGVTGTLVAAEDLDEDAGEPFATPYDACSPLTNAGQLAGAIALVNRGNCSFVTKTTNAEAAGATAVVVINSNNSVSPITGSSATITIPTVLIPQDQGLLLRATLPLEPVTVQAHVDPAPGADSYRWLLGEDVAGGAARDLWRPTCHGNAGAVTDAQYYCENSDNGGVHHNSAIPAHGYALLADGGNYHGINVPGIGLDKAAAIHFRAQGLYASSMTGFSEHADALEAACSSLIGQEVPQLSTVPNAPPVAAGTIASADCDAVAAMIEAVELRRSPLQCGFGPVLSPGDLGTCGAGYESHAVFSETFTATGLGGFVNESEVTAPGGATFAWARVGTGPTNHGPAAYARGTNNGTCGGGANDVTSHNLLISTPITLPAGGIAPRLRFDHYVATEQGMDGGNVKYRQATDDPWKTAPATSYLLNPMRRTLTSSATSTNPLAGQPAFTGTNGGTSVGSWGTSMIDLGSLQIDPTQPFQIAFDFGRDGCRGIDGWYVDNVVVSVCEVSVTQTVVQSPRSPAYGTRSSLTVSVARAGSAGPVPTGQVQVSTAAGANLGTVSLTNGVGVLALPTTLPAGTTSLRVSYLPTGSFAAATTTASATVLRAVPAIGAKLKKSGARPVVLVTATATGGVVTGKVTLLRKGKVVGKGTLSGGKVKIRLAKVPGGKLKLVVKYLGSANVSARKVTIRVR